MHASAQSYHGTRCFDSNILRFNLGIALECVLDFDLDVDGIQGRLECDLVRYRFDAAQGPNSSCSFFLLVLPLGSSLKRDPTV